MRTAYVLVSLVATTLTAAAEGTTAIVIPGRAGVPIIINGIDASYAVIESDWGLARGVHIQPTIYGGRPAYPAPPVGHYFPSLGSLPGYGRLEIEPPANRKKPEAAESYHRSYSAQSAPPAARLEVPFDPPPVIIAPGAVQNPLPNFPDNQARKYRN
ncbi:MAG: hypothetical protein JWR79_745 [Tardiphaga sp.]|nr:hypothetical protein [Tardiphaga sp.]